MVRPGSRGEWNKEWEGVFYGEEENWIALGNCDWMRWPTKSLSPEEDLLKMIKVIGKRHGLGGWSLEGLEDSQKNKAEAEFRRTMGQWWNVAAPLSDGWVSSIDLIEGTRGMGYDVDFEETMRILLAEGGGWEMDLAWTKS